jgi:hypothetical protein
MTVPQTINRLQGARTMAKKTFNISEGDTRKVQEIIGRAMTDKKFLAALSKNPRSLLAGYKLEKATLVQIERALKIKAQTEALDEQLAQGFGIHVEMG